MNKIVITGATSMIGVALTHVAVENQDEVYAIVRPDTKRLDRIVKSELVHVLSCNLDEIEYLEGLPSDCDIFYHLAWDGTSKIERDDPSIHLRNIQYTLNAVRLAKKVGCKRFIGAGSQAEYGPVEGLIDEQTKYEPVLSYGVAKYAAGMLAYKLCAQLDMEFVWGRVFSVYGPHDNDGTMIRYAIDCFERGETAYFSSGKQIWNYLYESDAGEIFYLLGNKDVPAGVYLVASDDSRLLKDYIQDVIMVYGPDAKASFNTEKDTKVYGINVNAERTFSALNFRPKISFIDGIKKIMNERNNTDGN